jgi:hypothetical protein
VEAGGPLFAPDRMSVWPVEGGRYGVDGTYQGRWLDVAAWASDPRRGVGGDRSFPRPAGRAVGVDIGACVVARAARHRVASQARRSICFMATSPEELALDLSRASLQSQEQSENQLREKATAVLAAASIVVPVAALAVGHGPAVVAIPFGGAAVAYALCVRECGAALFPQGVSAGLLGGELLETTRRSGMDLDQMQEAAATYLDDGYRHNRAILEIAMKRVGRAISLLTIEVLALVVSLVVTLVS